MKKILVTFLILSQAFAGDYVMTFTDKNYDETIYNNPVVIAKFTAPWCEDCKEFGKTFERVAKLYKMDGKPFIFGELDVTVYGSVGEQERVENFPYIILYVNEVRITYQGKMEYDDIVQFINKKTNPPSRYINNEKDITDVKRGSGLRCIYATTKKSNMKQYFDSALVMENYTFYHTEHENLVKVFPEVQPDNLLVLKDFDKGKGIYKGEIIESRIEFFLLAQTIPMISIVKEESLTIVYLPNGYTGIFVFYDPSDPYQDYIPDIIEEVSLAIGEDDYKYILTDVKSKLGIRVCENFGVDKSEVPMIGIIKTTNESAKYRYRARLTTEKIVNFIKNWQKGNVKRYLKSEENLNTAQGPVHKLSGKDFRKFIQDNEEDVLVKFYIPSCPYCRKLGPVYQELAETLIANKTCKTVFAEIDMMKNDIEGIEIERYPTVMLFPNKNKSNPILCETELNAITIAQFLKNESSIPFIIPEDVYLIDIYHQDDQVDDESNVRYFNNHEPANEAKKEEENEDDEEGGDL